MAERSASLQICRRARLSRASGKFHWSSTRRLRSRRGGEHYRGLEVDLMLGLGKSGELEAPLQKLVRGRSGQSKGTGIPPLELGQAAARADLGLEHPHIPLCEHDARFDILELRALGGDAKRNEIAAKRCAGAAGDHED